MTKLASWLRPPRNVLTIFVALAAVSAGALIFLVRLLFEQDSAVETQRRQERLEQGADRAVTEMRSELALLEHRASSAEANTVLADGVLVIGAEPPAAGERPKAGLRYYPDSLQLVPPAFDDPRFIAAERLEFAGRNPRAAADLYAQIASGAGANTTPNLRIAALGRQARTERKAADIAAALRTYGRIESFPDGRDVRIEGLPAGLVARVGRADIFKSANRHAELSREAAALAEDLQQGRWRLSRSEYLFYAEQAQGWLQSTGASAPAPDNAESIARSEAAAWLWKEKPWKQRTGAQGSAAERRLIQADGQTTLMIGLPESRSAVAVLASRRYFEPLCAAALRDSATRCVMTDLEGRFLAGTASPASGLIAIRTPAGAGLPWGVQVFPAMAGPDPVSPQRRVLFGLLAVVTAVWVVGMAFIVRALMREIRVSRMQSDFVAAVSHEFRSPLSSISQISELLLTDRLPSDDLRRKSYGVLSRESERLRTLVEKLLHFGRLEAGREVYQFEPLELGAFLEAIAIEFDDRVGSEGYHVELKRPEVPITARADREALTRAVTNLLENAVKYSPECKTVWMDLELIESEGGRVGITIRDRGLGIPEREQRDVFERFVRGSNSKDLRIKGTGIGLATALHIAQAHGGKILLSSRPGEGSRFTIVLPQHS